MRPHHADRRCCSRTCEHLHLRVSQDLAACARGGGMRLVFVAGVATGERRRECIDDETRGQRELEL